MRRAVATIAVVVVVIVVASLLRVSHSTVLSTAAGHTRSGEEVADGSTDAPQDRADVVDAAPSSVAATTRSGFAATSPPPLVRVYERKGPFRMWLHAESAGGDANTHQRAHDAYVVRRTVDAKPAVTTAGCVSPLTLAARKWRWVVRTLPPIVYNGQPCATATHRESMCGCDARALLVREVFVIATEGLFGSRVDVLAGTTSVGSGELSIVDRVSVFYTLHRCMGVWWDAPLQARDMYRRMRQAIQRNATVPIPYPYGGATTPVDGSLPARSVVVLQEGFYAADIHAYAPGHALDSILEGLGQYFIAGLHRRHVPWLVPMRVDGRSNAFWELATEFMSILAVRHDAEAHTIPLVPLPVDGHGPVFHVPCMWFASTPLGTLVPCYKPFLRNVLYPRALEVLRHQQHSTQHKVGGGLAAAALPPAYHRIALLKLTGDANVFTTGRTFHRTASFDALLRRHNVTLLRNRTIAERLYFLNEAQLIVTNFGASMSFIANLIVQQPTAPRVPLRVVVLVHGGYAHELRGLIGVHLALGEEFVVHDQLPRPWQLSYALATPGLRVKFLRVDSLDNVTDAAFSFNAAENSTGAAM